MSRTNNIKIIRKGKSISKTAWALEIIEKMTPIVEKIDNDKGKYTKMINSMILRINNSEETLSAKILDELRIKKISQTELGNDLGMAYKESYQQKDKSKNHFWKIFS